MTKEQLEVIIAVIAGTQAGIVALVGALKTAGAIGDVETIAAQIERSAAAVGADVKNREVIQMTLRHLVSGLRGRKTDADEEIRRLLH